ncbi:hypothetical protein C8J57DRAFT_73180 [Mycena rebaudengoi]|nr:hypothetical protein C8J57DRAFT_73180 [Mycena rebaudengoi]
MNCDFKRRLHDLRNIAEQLYGASDRAFDIPLALIATGNLPYHELHRTKTDYPLELGTVTCLTKQGWLVVGNILTELRDEGIIDISPFISNRIDDDEEQASPLEELIGTGNGIFSASVGDYKRYYFHQNRPFSLEIGQTTTTSLHNPRASEIRRRIQHYFHQRLPTLLKENSWHYRQPTDGFVLVTSVRSRRTTELEHNHDMTEGRDHKECLHCMMFGDRPEKDGASNDKHSIQGVYFHALPEESMAVSGPMEHNRWGCWTFHDGDREIQLEPPGRFSYTYNPDCGFEGAFEQLLD